MRDETRIRFSIMVLLLLDPRCHVLRSSQRTRELGVRMALGATPRAVMKLVISDGLRWTGVGVVIGATISIGILSLLERLLFEVKVHDVRVFAVATMILVVVATLAAWPPSRRAARIDPMVALRHE